MIFSQYKAKLLLFFLYIMMYFPNLDDLNDSHCFLSKFNLNSEDNFSNFDTNNNNSELNKIESNLSILNNNKMGKSSDFEVFNDNINPTINFDFHNNNFLSNNFAISSHVKLDYYDNNLKEIDTKLPDNKFLNKKRKLFKNLYPNEFFIFNRGGDNKNKRYIIDQFLENRNKIKSNRRKDYLKTRKENADNIRKKIKTRFFKTFIGLINQKLEIADSKKIFDLLPQKYVNNIAKGINKVIFDKTFKELFSTNFAGTENEQDSNFKKYKNNIDTLEYLEKQKDISEKSNYNCYKNLKLYQIFDEYLRSKEFEKDIVNLELEGEKDDYIYNYIKFACNLNNFFS